MFLVQIVDGSLLDEFLLLGIKMKICRRWNLSLLFRRISKLVWKDDCCLGFCEKGWC